MQRSFLVGLGDGEGCLSAVGWLATKPGSALRSPDAQLGQTAGTGSVPQDPATRSWAASGP